MNKYYWRPAFTVQVGQDGESDEVTGILSP